MWTALELLSLFFAFGAAILIVCFAFATHGEDDEK